MSFTSFAFLIFVGVVVLVYYLVPLKYRWIVLLAGSYFYYLQASAKSFVFILFTTIVTFYSAKYMGRADDEHKKYLAEHKEELTRDEKKARKEALGKRKKRVLALALILDFGILACLKYFRYYLGALGVGMFSGSVQCAKMISSVSVRIREGLAWNTGWPVSSPSTAMEIRLGISPSHPA